MRSALTLANSWNIYLLAQFSSGFHWTLRSNKQPFACSILHAMTLFLQWSCSGGFVSLPQRIQFVEPLSNEGSISARTSNKVSRFERSASSETLDLGNRARKPLISEVTESSGNFFTFISTTLKPTVLHKVEKNIEALEKSEEWKITSLTPARTVTPASHQRQASVTPARNEPLPPYTEFSLKTESHIETRSQPFGFAQNIAPRMTPGRAFEISPNAIEQENDVISGSYREHDLTVSNISRVPPRERDGEGNECPVARPLSLLTGSGVASQALFGASSPVETYLIDYLRRTFCLITVPPTYYELEYTLTTQHLHLQPYHQGTISLDSRPDI
jgi:hypothetical protein